MCEKNQEDTTKFSDRIFSFEMKTNWKMKSPNIQKKEGKYYKKRHKRYRQLKRQGKVN